MTWERLRKKTAVLMLLAKAQQHARRTWEYRRLLLRRIVLEDQLRDRFKLLRRSLTGIERSAWRVFYAARDYGSFVTTLAVTPAVFAKLLGFVRRCSVSMGPFFRKSIFNFCCCPCSSRRCSMRECPSMRMLMRSPPVAARRRLKRRMRLGSFSCG
jgi:hypothetical protein